VFSLGVKMLFPNMYTWLRRIYHISVFVPHVQTSSAAPKISPRPRPLLPRRPNPVQTMPEPSSAPSSAPWPRSWSSLVALCTTGSGNWPLMPHIMSCETVLGEYDIYCVYFFVVLFFNAIAFDYSGDTAYT